MSVGIEGILVCMMSSLFTVGAAPRECGGLSRRGFFGAYLVDTVDVRQCVTLDRVASLSAINGFSKTYRALSYV